MWDIYWKSVYDELVKNSELYKGLLEENKKLEKENKKLKESLDIATKCSSKEEDWIIRLSEENKMLKSELSKFRDSFKKYRDYEKEELAESCYDLAMENQKLKEEIGKLVWERRTSWELLWFSNGESKAERRNW